MTNQLTEYFKAVHSYRRAPVDLAKTVAVYELEQLRERLPFTSRLRSEVNKFLHEHASQPRSVTS